ncbi:MAG: 23S rRNA (adenine2503-C2)-methyltransferase [Bradymonadia bacterium]|jgi:23S rRNA (adenine2503-C2)-methyltransferase
MADLQTDDEGRILLKSLSLTELENWLVDGLGEKKFRAKQLWQWLYLKYASSFDEMTDLSKSFRANLEGVARVDVLEVESVFKASDGTRKILWKTLSGAQIESVLIPTENRNTLCISSQVGCAINCQFCLTAKMGLRGQLTAAEIVDQVVQTRRMFEEEQHLSNIVFMGMGEPLHNPDNVIPATNIMLDSDGLNMSRRKVTVSTSGLVPAIRRFGAESNARLAVSLNATTDEVRDWIMPINRKHPLDELLGALREYPLSRGERITFEYVMLEGVNDTPEDAKRLVGLVSNIPCKVNLIPFNPHPGTEFVPTSMERIREFQAKLMSKNVHTTVRETRGDDRMAACGQLGTPGNRMPKRMAPPEKFVDVVQAGADAPAPSAPEAR